MHAGRMADASTDPFDDEEMLDSLTIGRRIRQLRTERGMTLDELGAASAGPPSQVSVHRERQARTQARRAAAPRPRRSASPLDDLLSAEPPSQRAALEIALERAQRGPLYASLGLPPLPAAQDAERRRDRDDPRRCTTNSSACTASAPRHPRRRDGPTPSSAPESGDATTTSPSWRRSAKNCWMPSATPAARSRSASPPTWPAISGSRCTTCATSRHPRAASPTSSNGRIYLPVGQAGAGDPRSALLQALAEPRARRAGADGLRRLPAPAGRDELPRGSAARPRGERHSSSSSPRRSVASCRSRTCATPSR